MSVSSILSVLLSCRPGCPAALACIHILQVDEGGFKCLAAACLHSVLQSTTDLPKPAPSLADICTALDCSSPDKAEATLQELKVALKDDLASTSVS